MVQQVPKTRFRAQSLAAPQIILLALRVFGSIVLNKLKFLSSPAVRLASLLKTGLWKFSRSNCA
ncbi:hypothetical protein C7B67_07490 [filamentous cyanobacterium Phorm 6]|nr:hypothetical protein C7B67_07490 [filamentous cyanobacterium Phorm 6]